MPKIYGPAFDKEGNATGKLVEREIQASELAAYAAVGYKEGELTPEIVAADKVARKELIAEVKEEAKEVTKKSGRLPDGFPGLAALEEAGITTYAGVRKAGDLTEIAGIGEATAEAIKAAMEE